MTPAMIAILVPTWGRPERCFAMAASALALAAQPQHVQIFVRLSPNDPRCADYRARAWPKEVTLCVHDACDAYPAGINWLTSRAVAPILFAGGDDTLFRTPCWDDRVRDAFAAVPDGLLVAYANNGLNREKCEHFFTTRKWIDTVGYLMWPELRHFCCDQWVEELAAGVGRLQFLREVVVEHMHKKYRKAPDDDTYRLVRGNTGTSERDNAIFAARAPERAASHERLCLALHLNQSAIQTA